MIEADLKQARKLANQLADGTPFDPEWMTDDLIAIVAAFEDTFNRLVNINRALDEEATRLLAIIDHAQKGRAYEALAATLSAYNTIERIRRKVI